MRIDAKFSLALAMLAACAPALLAGCPGTLEDKDSFLRDAAGVDGAHDAMGSNTGDATGKDAATLAESGADAGPCGDVPARIFVPSCGGNGCHGAMASQNGLDLVSSGVATRLVGVTAKGCSATLADPKNPELSLIYTKLLPNPPCGSQMPLARPLLSAEDVACVRAWIAAQ